MDTKKITKNKFFYGVALFAASVFFSFVHTASAATLTLTPSSSVISPGGQVTVSVFLNSQGEAVNDAAATIVFPNDIFDVTSVSKNGSVMTLWVEEPSFSNANGTVTFEGGVPTPGYIGGHGAVLSATFRAKKAGQANFTLTNAAVRANDGMGTDVLSGKQGTAVTVVAVEVPTTPVTTTTPSTNTTASGIKISSATHPDQEKWYNDSNPVFEWTLPRGADAVRTSIGKNNDAIPSVTYSPAITTKSVEGLSDGTLYFKVRARSGGSWGSVSTYVVKIDKTSPQVKNVVFAYDDTEKALTVTADSKDTTSGLDHYDLYVNDALVKTITDSDFTNNSYKLLLSASGNNTYKLVVFDRAGNSTESTGIFHAREVVAPQVEPIPDLISSKEPLVVRGTQKDLTAKVVVMVKHDESEAVAYDTTVDANGNFFALIPTMLPGKYDIWAQTGPGENQLLSLHETTTATSELMLSVGALRAIASHEIPILLILLIIIVFITFVIVRHHGQKGIQIPAASSLSEVDGVKMIFTLKKHLEKHLEILQGIRRTRMLTSVEKEIKASIENDLDEVDEVIEAHKSK